MSIDFDLLVEDHFKKEGRLGFARLITLVEEIVNAGDLLTEDQMPPRAIFEWTMVPDIPISEIGWSDVSGEGAERVLGPQRALLERYLENIESDDGTFAGQIRALQEFYSPAGPQQLVAGSKNNAEAIGKLISYLVFYKTLTKVVTNFNASSAGFNFEAFLAVLMKGKQIPAKGAETIADFLTGDNLPISLKLYTKLKVGGSWSDLLGDIINPRFSHPKGNAVRYVAGIKKLSEADSAQERLKQRGEILLYQFDITLDNVINIMTESIHPAVCWLPEPLVRNGTDIHSQLPARDKIPSSEELENTFVNNLESALRKMEIAPQLKQIDPNFPDRNTFIESVLQDIAYGQLRRAEGEGSIFNKWQGLAFTRMPIRRGMSGPLLTKVLYPQFIKMYEKSEALPRWRGELKRQDILNMLKPLSAEIAHAHNIIVDSMTASEVIAQRQEILSGFEFVKDPEVIREYYDGLNSEQKKIALQNTYGYITDQQRQWDLNETQATNPGYPTYTEDLGEIKVGGAYVEEMLKYVSAALNEEIFAVFTSLKALSESLNGFFAGGLADDSEAERAIENAQDIETKTTELKSTK